MHDMYMQIKYFCEYVTVIIIMFLLCHSDDLVCNKWILISPRGVMRIENLQYFVPISRKWDV
jgi:hypothetical protein